MSLLKLCFQVAHEDECLVPVSSVFWRSAVLDLLPGTGLAWAAREHSSLTIRPLE